MGLENTYPSDCETDGGVDESHNIGIECAIDGVEDCARC